MHDAISFMQFALHSEITFAFTRRSFKSSSGAATDNTAERLTQATTNESNDIDTCTSEPNKYKRKNIMHNLQRTHWYYLSAVWTRSVSTFKHGESALMASTVNWVTGNKHHQHKHTFSIIESYQIVIQILWLADWFIQTVLSNIQRHVGNK